MRNPSSSSHNDLTSSSKHKSKTTPCCSKVGIKKGPWTREEDAILADYIKRNGEGQWRTLPQQAGLLRCGKSCRLRWMNYLRPSIKRGPIASDEEDLILRLHRLLGNRWSLIAGRIPGRTDNEIKNFWNTHLSKKLINKGIDPRTHKPFDNIIANPNPNSNSIHCPSCSELPRDNPNPNPNYSCLEERNESRKYDQCNSQTPAEEDTDVHHGNYRTNEGLMEIKSDDHHDQNQGNNKELEPVNSNGCDHEDAAFSSFLDSLINDEIELINQVQVLQSDVIVDDHEPAVLPFSSSSSRSMNSCEHIHDAFWEDEFVYAMETISGAEENMALVFDNQQNT